MLIDCDFGTVHSLAYYGQRKSAVEGLCVENVRRQHACMFALQLRNPTGDGAASQ